MLVGMRYKTFLLSRVAGAETNATQFGGLSTKFAFSANKRRQSAVETAVHDFGAHMTEVNTRPFRFDLAGAR